APSLLGLGTLGSRPWATGEPDGTMDVFWRGSADDNLWLASYVPGRGWRGPQNLGGHLYPVSWRPVVSAARTTESSASPAVPCRLAGRPGARVGGPFLAAWGGFGESASVRRVGRRRPSPSSGGPGLARRSRPAWCPTRAPAWSPPAAADPASSPGSSPALRR